MGNGNGWVGGGQAATCRRHWVAAHSSWQQPYLLQSLEVQANQHTTHKQASGAEIRVHAAACGSQAST